MPASVRYCPTCHSVYPNEFRTCPKDQQELLAASELQPGMVLRGKYEIAGRLGAGGMAAVYKARHLAFGEVRAIKVVNSRLADDEEFLRRFRNEAIVARRLQHPNAVRVDDLDMTEDGRPFIVMEYVEGLNLREVIRREGPLSLRRGVRIARQVASALAAAHDLGIVHRDIKPDNILLAGSGEAETAKVLDFGIAKMKESALGDSGAIATRTGMVVGTPQYISPEQAMGRRGSEIDGRADLYSLGVVLYEMVTGRLPFESDTAMGIILHHLQTPPPSPRDVRPDLGIPEPLSAVLLRALEKDRDHRFPSATAMAAALDDVMALPLAERPADLARPSESTRLPTPSPVPADIEFHETRVMPKTPPVGARTPVPSGALPAAVPAGRTPPPFGGTPPPGGTPSPAGTMARSGGGATWTPVPSPTVVAGGAGMATPPPLPPPTAVLSAPPSRPRKRRRWWMWVAAAAVLFSLLHRGRGNDARRPRGESPSPAASVESAGDEDSGGPSDAALAAAVARAIHTNPLTRRADIEVDVDERVVSLSGHASPEAARQAEEMARRVDGVREVRNTIDTEGQEGDQAEKRGHRGPQERPELPGIGAIRGIPFPPVPRGRPSPDAEAVKRLLKDAQEAMRAENYGEAMGKFGAVLGMDPDNQEARAGLKAATVMLGETIRRHVIAPSPPPPPSPK